MTADSQLFAGNFLRLTGYQPMLWQHRLFDQFTKGRIPAALDLPTGLGKTSVIAIWILARALAREGALRAIPRRLVYVVDRRAVVDQATAEAEKLRAALESDAKHLKEQLRLDGTLPISTLRGAHVGNREWLDDPAAPAIVVGTVDMIGSRLLFEGYGVSRKMRPYHAGLLGTDTLIVLDEAHLVPPFAFLVRAIEGEAAFSPKDRLPLSRFIVLPLSATQRELPEEESGRKSFGLEEEDWRDDTASHRLNARKQLHIESLVEKDHNRQLGQEAFALATRDRPARVVVFCNRREKKDDGTGPSAQGVAEALEILAKGDKKAGSGKIDIEPPEMLVGARRVYEREQIARRLQKLGFTGPAEPPARPAFLVATSAGEVGVDLDADHIVCDLVPWERMVQRLGRVNRRGGEGRKAKVIVFDTSGLERDEASKGRLIATRGLLARIEGDFGGEAGPAALRKLRGQVGQQEIEKASTPEPLHPALTRALVDAWSMTSLEHHTGRPEVAPWLRGWVAENPQTTVVWRKFLPLRVGEDGRITSANEEEVNEFFGAAPPHESEKLETETYRVAQQLHDRANKLLRLRPPKEPAEPADPEEAASDEACTRALQRNDVVVLILSPGIEYERHLTLGDLAQDRKGRRKDEFHNDLAGRILVVDARFGGLKNGMLDDEGNDDFPTADVSDVWSEEAQFRVRRVTPDDHESTADDWLFEDAFVLRSDANGNPREWLVVEHFRNAAQSEEGRSVSEPQELGVHQKQAEQRVLRIAEKIGLSSHAAEVLALAALLHDEGKRAPRWQRAFRAPREKGEDGAYKVYAKTKGPIDQKRLDGYRHEFGSLAVFELGNDRATQLPAGVRRRIDDLPEDWRDLLLHLIAAHHGQARPVIATRGCEDAPPSALEARASDVALRFARLQKCWGPWGLGWWEALLRAADQQASRDNDRREGSSASHSRAT